MARSTKRGRAKHVALEIVSEPKYGPGVEQNPSSGHGRGSSEQRRKAEDGEKFARTGSEVFGILASTSGVNPHNRDVTSQAPLRAEVVLGGAHFPQEVFDLGL